MLSHEIKTNQLILMKKQILSVAAIGLISGSILFVGCGKEDTMAPVITLNGNATEEIYTGDTYTDAGATASDDEDGDVTSSIAVTGAVDNTKAGEYTLKYNVSDAAGNAASEVERTVIVKHKNTTVAGTYSVTESCNFGAVPAYAAAITASSANTVDITLTNFGNFSTTINVTGTVSGTTGQTVTIPSAVYNGLTISGTGTINAAASSITITYTSSNGTDTDTCTATWTKQ